MVIRRKGVPSRRRVHPRTRVGGGARQIQVICVANDAGDGGRGRSGAKRNGVLREGTPFLLPNQKKRMTSSLSDFLVILFVKRVSLSFKDFL